MEQINEAPELEAMQDELIEGNAQHWAGRAVDALQQRDAEVTPEAALETLATLDAEFSITDLYDVDEFDTFLDEFEDAVEEQQDKADELQDRIEGAGNEVKPDTEGA